MEENRISQRPSAKMKDMKELTKLVSKTLAECIRFTISTEMRDSCFESLNVTNSFDAEKVLQKRLTDWIQPASNNKTVILPPPPKRQKVEMNQLDLAIQEAEKDLDGWE